MNILHNRIRSVLRVILFGGMLSTAISASAAGSEDYLGSIDFVGFNYAPRGWATCDGQLLSIAQNSALFALLGTTYGGNGQTTFALPDLRGRVPMHMGQGPGLSNRILGENGGSEAVTLNVGQMPAHSHPATTTVDTSGLKIRANTGQAATPNPAGNALSSTGRNNTYNTAAPDVDMAANSVGGTASATTTIGTSGGSQPVQIMPPYLVLNCIVALEGLFPSRN
ncbi:MAG: tail fiber protein [Methylocaldum sp.]|jgi:microcystin-dependent protein|nr:tail fiber protein [Methylocaldum sp.]